MIIMAALLLEEVEEELVKLRKDQIGELLKLSTKEVNRTRKNELLSSLMKELRNNNLLLNWIFKKFAKDLGLHPCRVEEKLQISKAERLRWTSQKKLKIVGFSSFNKWGKQLEYPLYDSIQIKNISEETIQSWRNQHMQKVKTSRKKALDKAQNTRNQNLLMQKQFYKKTWPHMLKEWYLIDGKLGASLHLAFWTMWVNRWAKEFQVKARNARTHREEYKDKTEQFYSMKNEAIQRLIHSPYTNLSFYEPFNPDKITHLMFCENHFDLWMTEREFDYVSKWDFYSANKKDIHSCRDCEIEIEEDFFSLYYFSIGYQDYQYSFHTPYPIGKFYLPSKETLPQITHEEQEGLFRFGRSLYQDEKIIFKEKEVIKHFHDALLQFDLYFNASSNCINHNLV